jgi:hypothetical protein
VLPAQYIWKDSRVAWLVPACRCDCKAVHPHPPLQRVRASRDAAAVQAALAALEAAAHSGDRSKNLMELAVAAARLRCKHARAAVAWAEGCRLAAVRAWGPAHHHLALLRLGACMLAASVLHC